MAEVLITLGIIGVVAALTMPTLIANHQKKEAVTRLQKAYSEIQQALLLKEAEIGPMNTWDFNGYTEYIDTTRYFFENYLSNLKIIKKCIPTTEECWSDTYNAVGVKTSFKGNMNGSGGYSSVVTQSGYSLFSQNGLLNNGCHTIVLDTNGKKGPNKLGHDVFLLIIDFTKPNKNLEFHHITDEMEDVTDEWCTKDCSGLETNRCGWSCGAKIQKNSWKIPEDYPW